MESVTQSGSGENFEGVIRIEEGKIRSHVDQVVRETVEQTLNGLLQAEADDLCGAKRYSRSPERLDTRAGHYDRKLHTVNAHEKLTHFGTSGIDPPWADVGQG